MTGAHIVLATHAAPFLQLSLQHVEYYKVLRDRSRRTQATRITGEIIEALSASAAELGVSAATLIQLTRGWLIVEGEHDRLIIDAFFREQLRAAWVQTLALRGAARAKASFLTLQALKPLGIPFFVLLDNVRAAQVRSGEIPTGASEEERIAADLVRVARDETISIAIYGLTYPDVLCMLPPDAVRRAATNLRASPTGFESWDELIAVHEQERESTPAGRKPPNFKSSLLEAVGLKGRIGIDDFLRQVVDALAPNDQPHPELERIIAEVTAAAAAQPADAATR